MAAIMKEMTKITGTQEGLIAGINASVNWQWWTH